ncbi:C40 family peptidase [Streptomyces thermolilacinus]|uniref:C40 family peptidase n=1 Tax=Streptomyces thermolilacinus TaxID=285540 RepID=UPI0034067CA2
MASHRKPRGRTTTRLIGAPSPAVGLTTAAVASMTFLSAQSAGAAPVDGPAPGAGPSVEEVQRKVDDLYRQAVTATQRYGPAKEAADRQQDEAAWRTRPLDGTRGAPGGRAAPQHRPGAPLLAEGRVKATRQVEAARRAESPAVSQAALRTAKRTVQAKLARAGALLDRLTDHERERATAVAEGPGPALPGAPATTGDAFGTGGGLSGAGGDAFGTGGTGVGGTAGAGDRAYAAKAEKVLAFALAQVGKPYVRGAAGPSSYDCSGLTQAAWKAAGVDLPRTAEGQAEAGRRVASGELLPGDLVFFHDDGSHVAIYAGGGRMIHAPSPGGTVCEEPVGHLPLHGAVRPA